MLITFCSDIVAIISGRNQARSQKFVMNFAVSGVKCGALNARKFCIFLAKIA